MRSMAVISLMDMNRNKILRQRTGLGVELATRVDMNVRKWFGHVERMENECTEESNESKRE